MNKLELIILVFGTQYPDNPASKSICSFTSNLLLIYSTLQFFYVIEMAYFHALVRCLLFNKEQRILNKMRIFLKKTLHRSYRQHFQVKVGTREVFRDR